MTLDEMLAAARARRVQPKFPLKTFLLLLSRSDPRDMTITIAYLSQWLNPKAEVREERSLTVWENNHLLQSIKNWTGIPLSIIYDEGKNLKWPKYPW
jgi:hypothetical protein